MRSQNFAYFMTRQLRIIGLVTLMISLAGIEARAAQPSAVSTTTQAVSLTEAQWNALLTETQDMQTATRAWWWTWLGVTPALGIGSLALALTIDENLPDAKGRREANYLATGLAAVGFLSTVLQAPVARNAMDELDQMPSDTPKDRVARQQRALALRDADIAKAKRTRSWINHGVATVLGLGGGLTLALRHDDWWLGARSALGTILVTELRIWTRPDYDDLNADQEASAAMGLLNSIAISPWGPIGEHAEGVMLGGRF